MAKWLGKQKTIWTWLSYSELFFCSFLQVHLEKNNAVRTKTIEIKSILFFWMQLFNWSDLANQADLSDCCHHCNGRSLQSSSKEQVQWGGQFAKCNKYILQALLTLFSWSILASFEFKSIASLIEGEGMIYQEISNVKCNLIAGRPCFQA